MPNHRPYLSTVFRLFSITALLVHAMPRAARATEPQFTPNSERGQVCTDEVKDGETLHICREGRVKHPGDREVGKITDEEEGQLQARRKALSFWSFGFGPFFPHNLNSSGLMYGFEISRHWDVLEHAELRAGGTLILGGDPSAGYGDVTLGAGYFFSTQDISPIVGADFGMGGAWGSNVSSAFGFAASVGAGIRFFRTSNVQLEIGGKYSLVLHNGSGLPGVEGFELRLLF